MNVVLLLLCYPFREIITFEILSLTIYFLRLRLEITFERREYDVCIEWATLCCLEVFLRAHDNLVEVAETCTGRDEVARDDILLHTYEWVALATDGCFVEHLCSLLEGGR